MSSVRNGPLGGEAPRWLLIVSALLIVSCLFYFGRNAIAGRAPEPGPPKKVYPNMYDLRAEAKKYQANAGQRQPAGGNP